METRMLLSEQVAEKIKEMIREGKFPAGEQIPSENELSKQLNVSVRTVREAVKFLISRNILVIQRGVGTFACEIPGVSADPFGFEFMDSAELYTDLLEIRLLLEPEIIVLAAKRASKEELDAAEDILEQVQTVNKTITENDLNFEEAFEMAWQLDLKFHEQLYEASHNSVANRLLPLISKTLWEIYSSGPFKEFRKSNEFYSRHRDILAAMRNKDYKLIRKLCKLHIFSGAKEGGK